MWPRLAPHSWGLCLLGLTTPTASLLGTRNRNQKPILAGPRQAQGAMMSQHLSKKHRPPGGKGTSSPKQPNEPTTAGIKDLEFQCRLTPAEPSQAFAPQDCSLPRCSQAVHTREPGQHHPAHPLWIPRKLSQADFCLLCAGLRSSRNGRVCVSRLLKLLRHSCGTHSQDLRQEQGQRLTSGCDPRNQTQGRT